MAELLTVQNLTINHRQQTLVEGVHFSLKEKGCLGIVGESGSGKSLTCRALINLLPKGIEAEGQVMFQKENLLTLPHAKMRAIRGQDIAMIVQNSMTAFNPIFTIGHQLVESLRTHKQLSKEQAKALIIESFTQLLLKDPEQILKKYPYELSGGMLQRIVISIAVLMQPKIIIADEPTTALDSITQLEVIKVLQEVKQLLQCGLIIVSHDLGVISALAEDILVMKKGQQVEYGTIDELFSNPKEAYTQHLFNTKFAISKKYNDMLGGLSTCSYK